jgi:hypothetical protein
MAGMYSGMTSAHARSPPIGAAEGSLLKGSLDSHITSQPLSILLLHDALRSGLCYTNCIFLQLLLPRKSHIVGVARTFGGTVIAHHDDERVE